MVNQETIKDIAQSLKTTDTQKNNTHQAIVSHVDREGVVWVNVAGSEVETPTEAIASEVNPGDAVTVEWRNNKLYIAGNYSDPSAGMARTVIIQNVANQANDTAEMAIHDATIAHDAAISATESAATAGRAASVAQSAAEAAQATADTKKTVFITQPTPPYHVGDLWAKLGEDLQDLVDDSDNNLITDQSILLQAAILTDAAVYVCVTPKIEGQTFDDADWSLATADTSLREWFWHDSLGAHILGDVTGFRNDLDSTGMHIIDTNTETSVAEFTANEAQVGADDAAHISITTDGFDGVGSDGASYFGFKATEASVENEIRKSINGDRSTGYIDVPTVRTQLFSKTMSVASIPTGTTCTVKIGNITIRPTSHQYISSSGAQNCQIQPFNGQTPASIFYIIRNSTTITIGTSVTRSASVTARLTLAGSSNYTILFEISIVYDATTNKVTVSLYTTASTSIRLTQWIYASGYIKYSEIVNAPLMTFGTRAEDGGGALSSSLGQSLYASGENQTAIGKFNIQDNNDEYAFIIGNGDDDDNRDNALTVDWSGNVEAAGDITSNGVNLTDIVSGLSAPLIATGNNVSIPSASYKTIASLTLPANGKYIVVARGGCGSGSSLSNEACQITTTSGTATEAYDPIQITTASNGGPQSLTGYYVTGSTAITVSFQIYLYGSGTATGGNCWMLAFPIG